jgi:hypothetical protein
MAAGGEAQEETAFVALTGAMAGLRALLGDETRGPALRRWAVLLGKWLLGGIAVSLLIAGGEVSILGFVRAWSAYGLWWLVTPAIVVAIPITLLSARFTMEVIFLAVLLPVLWLGEFLGPWSGRALRLVAKVAFIGFCAWFVWMIGEMIATPPAHPVAPPIANGAPVPAGGHSGAWAWVLSHGFAGGAVFGSFLLKMLESLVPDWLKHKFKKRPAGKKAVILGADGRPVREVTLD